VLTAGCMACRAAVQAFAVAIIGLDPRAQDLLVRNIAAALVDSAIHAGCDIAAAILGFLQAALDPDTAVPAVSPAQMKLLCDAVPIGCSTACTDVVGR
jgi:hypothetical protein